nr:IclR family transcriptional regulator C-terminal domain-containing protein [Auraticoccus cholistanensis]
MVALRDRTGETVGLSIRTGWSRVFIEEVQSTLPLRFASELGVLYPLWSGATGRILMLDLDEDEVEQALADRTGGERLHRALTPPQARELLERARRDGWAGAADETIAGVRSLAVPVRGPHGEVVAALSVSGPGVRLAAAEAEVLTALQQSATRLGRTLGRAD